MNREKLPDYPARKLEQVCRELGIRLLILQILYQSIHSCLEDYHAYLRSVSDFLMQLES